MGNSPSDIMKQRNHQAVQMGYADVFELVWMPVEEMANRADHICCQNVDEEWLENQLVRPLPPNMEEWLNGTSLGNAAYMALYAIKEQTRQLATRQLEKMCNWVMAQ